MRLAGYLITGLFCLTIGIPHITAQFAWTNIHTSVSKDQVDLWTATPQGCVCPYNASDRSCACCMTNGCHCGPSSPQRCAQCGLERYCDSMCNITISSVEIASRSSQTFGEIKSPTSLYGPSFCWFRLIPEAHQRVEIQIYRVKRLGKFSKQTNRCSNGFLQLVPDKYSDVMSPTLVSICGANERFSPPIVLFGEAGAAKTLLFRNDEISSMAQFLAHYSFTPIDKKDTGIQIHGGQRLYNKHNESGCDWSFDESVCSESGSGCQLASPGSPGLYPPDVKCQYLIQTSSKRKVDMKLFFKYVNLPVDDCERHKISIYAGGSATGPLLRTLCGFVERQEVLIESQHKILIQFSSGFVGPPYNYNGFKASLEFIRPNGRAIGNKSGAKETAAARPKEQRAKGKSGGEDEEDEEEEQEEEAVDDYEDEEPEEEEEEEESAGRGETRDKAEKHPKVPHQSGPMAADGGDCYLEFNANLMRSGYIKSSDLPLLKQDKCVVAFKGNPHDVLLIRFNSYKLRGKNCKSSVTIMSKSMIRRGPEQGSLVERICSPATRKPADLNGRTEMQYAPLLINSSSVLLEFRPHHHQAANAATAKEGFDAWFQFQQVIGESLARGNLSCNLNLYGHNVASPQGLLEAPSLPDWDVSLVTSAKSSKTPATQCKTSLTPTASQSVSLSIQNSHYDGGHPDTSCETHCDNGGCRCLVDEPTLLKRISHIRIESLHGQATVACFCGHFGHLLPVTIFSGTTLSLVYNQASKPDVPRLKYKAAYGFYNEVACGPRTISSPLGSLESPLVEPVRVSRGFRFYYQRCQWFFDPPPSRQLLLKISTVQKMDCLTWNATIALWNSSFPDEMGSIIDKFCPEISAKEYILNTTERKIVISLQSLSRSPIHYLISWESRGQMHHLEDAGTVNSKEIMLIDTNVMSSSISLTSSLSEILIFLWIWKIAL